jgi:DNA-directed RNA polymerase specialized sigma subunit
MDTAEELKKLKKEEHRLLEESMKIASDRRLLIVRLAKGGMSLTKIADTYGMTKQRVSQMIQRAKELGEY